MILLKYTFMTGIMSCLVAALSTAPSAAAPTRQQTFCNPMDLPYCFREDDPVRREAADPTLTVFHGEYWLFPSKSEGYWHSKDFIHWEMVIPTGLPIDDYAPDVAEINGKLYWTACQAGIYTTDDPLKGVWTKASDEGNRGDPALFVDDDKRVYLYSGCTNGGPISVVELDPANGFKELMTYKPLMSQDIAHHGAEIMAEPDVNPPYDEHDSWIEGSFMTKHDGKYYLQYACPGTQFKSYSDGVYVGNSPTGPFTYCSYSPFSSKPTGFVAGAGHSSTFQDLGRRYWHIVTMTISVRQMFERRLGVFPTWFEPDGQMVCNTYFGDYPQYVPGVVKDPSKGNGPGWMLLTLNKSAQASSTLDNHPVSMAFDENIRTWWSAKTGNPGEWLQVDLGKVCRVDAAQVNFADEGAQQHGHLKDGYGYVLQVSLDGNKWTAIVDRSKAPRDAPHDYVQLDHPVMARYAKLTNTHSPAEALFSVSGLRLFGSGLGHAPGAVTGIDVARDSDDQRQATISWNAAPNADGYVVRYGVAKDRLFSNYQVYGNTTLHIHTLNVGVPYFFSVDSFNDTAVTQGKAVVGG